MSIKIYPSRMCSIIVASLLLLISIPGFAVCETQDACAQQYVTTATNVQKSYLNYFNNLQLGPGLGGGRFQGKLAKNLSTGGGPGGPQLETGGIAAGTPMQGGQPQGNSNSSGIRYN